MAPDATLSLFDDDEIDALLLGLQHCIAFDSVDEEDQEDEEDQDEEWPAFRALRKIEAALPPPEACPAEALAQRATTARDAGRLAQLAIRYERALRLSYVDAKGRVSDRVVWPVSLGPVGGDMAAWCETRRAFRHFRFDRVREMQLTGESFGRRHRVLLAEWRSTDDRSEW